MSILAYYHAYEPMCIYIYSTCIDITIYTFIIYIYILTLIDTIRRRRTSTQLCMLLINQEARVNP